MKIKLFFLFLFLGIMAGCSQGNPPTLPKPSPNPDLYPCGNLPEERAENKAFKGIELYSYPNKDDQWVFSVLVGTNRSKTYTEVTGHSLDVDQLEDCFCKLAVGEWVSWSNTSFDPSADESIHVFPIPPDSLISEVKSLALTCEIELGAIIFSD